MQTIMLTQGKVALVDDEDYDWLSQWKWCATRASKNKWYAKRRTKNNDKTPGQSLYMHRVLVGTEAREVDHKDGNGLNNQRVNLRPATRMQNGANMRRRSKRMYHGVTRTQHAWLARIHVNYRTIHLGSFRTIEQAARAYDAAAKEKFGEFAHLNFP